MGRSESEAWEELREIVFILAAELDISSAYEIHGEALHEKIDAELRLLQQHPEIGPVFKGRFRRRLVLRSTFAIYYSVEGERIVVCGVTDQRQSPEKIEERLKKL